MLFFCPLDRADSASCPWFSRLPPALTSFHPPFSFLFSFLEIRRPMVYNIMEIVVGTSRSRQANPLGAVSPRQYLDYESALH